MDETKCRTAALRAAACPARIERLCNGTASPFGMLRLGHPQSETLSIALRPSTGSCTNGYGLAAPFFHEKSKLFQRFAAKQRNSSGEQTTSEALKPSWRR